MKKRFFGNPAGVYEKHVCGKTKCVRFRRFKSNNRMPDEIGGGKRIKSENRLEPAAPNTIFVDFLLNKTIARTIYRLHTAAYRVIVPSIRRC